MSIVVDNISKTFNHTKVLNNISLNITFGDMVALLGPSGSGKTTLLRVIAGLEHHNSGYLYFGGKNVTSLHARDRHVGFVFQHYALFRHMTVEENIAFGLKVLPRRIRPNAIAIHKKVSQLLEMVQLKHLAHRYPSQLSGGQKQRVALARALSVEPNILLLDEPFGALDAQVRKELRRWLRQLHNELKFTGVFVTHDQEEAMEVADLIVIMSQGNIEQVGTPQDVWRAPANRFVLEFLGEVNRLEGEIRCSQLFVGSYHWPLPYSPDYQGKVDLILRPWEIAISKELHSNHPLPVKILDAHLRGYYWRLIVQPIVGIHQQPLIVVIPVDSDKNAPKRNEQYYLGSQNVRLYVGEKVLQPMMISSENFSGWRE